MLLNYNKRGKILNNYKNLIGKTKQEVVDKMGLQFNDIHANIWYYTLYDEMGWFGFKYLYVFFANNQVIRIEPKRFKKDSLM